jgi:predicted acetyltransferase
MNDKVELVSASKLDKKIVYNLFRYYVYDMSEYMGWNPSKEGIYGSNTSLLEIYWENDDHYPYLVYCNDELAGFSLLRKYPADKELYDIGQFFVLRKFKRKGVGGKAFELSVSKYPGKWLTRVLLDNTGALKFWLSAIAQITNDNFSQAIEQDEDLNMHFIRYNITSG